VVPGARQRGEKMTPGTATVLAGDAPPASEMNRRTRATDGDDIEVSIEVVPTSHDAKGE
jgi:hypothetical protein